MLLRVLLSVLLGAVGYVLGLGVQIQLNASLTGNYQRNFLGDDRLNILGATVGGLFGLAVPWLPLLWRDRDRFRRRRSMCEPSPGKRSPAEQAAVPDRAGITTNEASHAPPNPER
jgi:hypothetical protein